MGLKIIHNVLAKGGLTIFNLILPLAVMPYIYRVLDPHDLGMIEYATAIVTYFSIFGMLGIYNYGLREMSSIRNNLNSCAFLYRQLFTIGVLSNIFSATCLLLLSFFMDKLVKDIVYIQLLLIVSQIFYVEWVNEAFERYSFITLKTILVRGLGYLSIFGLVTSSNDYKTYVWILSITVFINYFISYLYVKKKLPIESVQVDWNFIKKIIFALFLILLLNNTNLLYTLLDRFMLGLKSDIYVAYYGVGQKLSDMLKAFLTIVVVVTIPRMSLQLNQNKERYLENINHLISFLFLLTLPIASLFFCLSKEIVILFAGENYLEAIPSLKIFAIRIVVIVLEAVLYNQIIFLYRREKDLLKLNALCGCLNLGLNGVLYSFLNPFLAILTTLVSELVFQILCIYYIRTKIGLYITYAKKSNLLYLLLSILFPLWIYVIHLFFTSAFVVIFFSCFLSLITYIIGLYLFKDKMFLLACEKIKDSIC